MQSKMAQDAPKMPQDDPKMAPRSSKMAPDSPKMPKDGRRGFQDGSTSGRRGAFKKKIENAASPRAGAVHFLFFFLKTQLPTTCCL